MTTDFAKEAGGVLDALPLERMFQVPASAFAATQMQLSRQYLEFVKQVGLDEDGNVKMVTATVDEPVLDGEGNVVRTVTRQISIPLLAIVDHPNVNVQEGSIDFELTIESSTEQHSETEAEGSADVTLGWGFIKAKVHARASHKSSQTRRTDTRARYTVSMRVARDELPEGMQMFLETVRGISMRPRQLPDPKPTPSKPAPPKPAAG